MDCQFNMEDMVPFVALEKLKVVMDIKTATPADLLSKFSELVWEFESAYHDIAEHKGFKWEGNRLG